MQKLGYLLMGLLTVHSARAVPDRVPTAQEAPSSRGQTLVGNRVSVKPLDLSRAPTTDELIAAGQLGGPLFPTHELKDGGRDEAARWAFGRAIEQWNRHEYGKAVGVFRKYVEQYPDSPWAAEAELHIGCDASYNGRYTEADALFNKLINDHQGKEHPGAKMLRNKARQRLALLKVAQNNLEAAGLHFQMLLQDSPDWRHRTYASHWLQRLSRYAAAKNALVNCGAEALAYVLEKAGRPDAALAVRTNLPATTSGHSLGSLARLSASQGYELAAVRIPVGDLARLPLPAILHISPGQSGDKGHYWVLDKLEGDTVEVFDPQSKHRFHQSLGELAREWSGRALVFAKGGSAPGERLRLEEMEESFGGCCGIPAKEDDLGDPCRNGAGGSEDEQSGCSQGAPAWKVDMVNLNVFMTDTPLWYSPPIGPPVRITLSYNSESGIAQNEPFGNKWQFNYASYLVADTAGTVTVFMPDGRRDVFAPNSLGGYAKPYQVFNTLTKLGPNWFELRFPNDMVYVYQVPAGTGSEQPFLVAIRDAWGQQLTFGYNYLGELTTITDAQGLVTHLTYNASGLVTTVADPFGRQAVFQYDYNGNLTRITDMGGYWTGLNYDASVYLTAVSNERGTWSFRIEPADGIDNGSNPYPPPGGGTYQNYRVSITDPLGQTTEYHYDGYSAYSWYVSPRDYQAWSSPYQNNYASRVAKTCYYFKHTGSGDQGELSRIVYPEGDTISYGYNSATGDRVSVTDAHDHTLTRTFNALGRITLLMDPKDTKTFYSYAPNQVDLVRIANNLGQTVITYDSYHQVVSIQDSRSNITQYSYNSFGQVVTMVDADGVNYQYVYDANNRLSQITRAGYVVARYTYDAIGRVVTRTDATGLTRSNEYNSLNELTRTTYPDGRSASFTYSSCCPRLVDSVTDRAGRTTRFAYDALKRLVQVINPEGGVVQYGYDASGNKTRFVDLNGSMTSFAYDGDNRLTGKTFADGKGVSYLYDPAGLLMQRTDARGVVTTYSYDRNHHPTVLQYSDGTPGVTNAYDNFGRLVTSQDALGTHTYSYDAASRLVSDDGPWANDTITCGYDALGRLTNVLVQGSPAIGQTRDALGRLTAVTVGASAYLYGYTGASPLVQQLTRPNGSYSIYQYDSLNRITGVTTRRSSGEVVTQFQYTYNTQGLRSGVTVSNVLAFAFNTNQTTRWAFNPLNQLTNASPPNRSLAFDAAGNLTQGLTPEGQPFAAVYDAENRLRSIAYTNLAGKARQLVYTYSGRGLLAQVQEVTNGLSTNYTRFVRYSLPASQERDGSNNVIRAYAWGRSLGGGIGGLLDLTQAGQHYSYVYDGCGNVESVLDGAQAKVAAYAYDPFGLLLAKSGSLDQPVRFSTMPCDEGTGLAAFPYRTYSAILGRWTSRDPLYESSEENLYAFVGNNPLQYADPLGRDPVVSGGPPTFDPNELATIACGENGEPVPVMNKDMPFWWKEDANPCVYNCLKEHEQSHIEDVRNVNRNICKDPSTKGKGIEFNSEKERLDSEVRAYEAEIECLQRALANPGKCPQGGIRTRIEHAAELEEDFKRQQEDLKNQCIQ